MADALEPWRPPRGWRRWSTEAAVGLAVLPLEPRRKRLLLCDMDSTIITIECIDELADFAGIKPRIAEITRRAMDGELDFAAALRERVALLAGLPRRAIDEVIRERLRLMPGARTLVRTMRAHGACTALVSGGFTAFTRHVQALCGFDREEANELEIEGDRLTGRLVGQLRGPRPKLAALERLRAGMGIEPRRRHGGRRRRQRPADAQGRRARGRVPRPPARAAVAPVRIDHGDLTALLFLKATPRRVRRRAAAAATAGASRSRLRRLFLEAQRDEAQVALAVDQQQDRLLALLLRLVDLGHHLGRRADLLLADLDDQVARPQVLLGRRGPAVDLGDHHALGVLGQAVLGLLLRPEWR